MSRYYVSELEGYLSPFRGRGVAGRSFTVHDRLFNCQAVAVFRTEDSSGLRGIAVARQRERALRCAAELEAQAQDPDFEPTCPRCATISVRGAWRCDDCGAILA